MKEEKKSSSQQGTTNQVKNFLKAHKKIIVERSRSSSEIKPDDFYFPGHIHISTELMEKYHFKTLSDPTTNLNEIFYFVKVYERAEEFIKKTATKIYLDKWRDMLVECEAFFDAVNSRTAQNVSESNPKFVGKLYGRLKAAIHSGPTVNDINEVLADIRRNTYIKKEEMNPSGYSPFLNGLLNLKTRKLEKFNPDLFYTWQIQANYLDHHVTLLDTPKFAYYLSSTFYEIDIPMILSYGGYSLQPNFKRNKIHFIVGRERVGKGVWPRLLRGLNPKGYSTISFEKLLISENRFAFQNVQGKNLLVDPEMKRVFNRGFKPDFANINKLFGGDTIDVERKGQNIDDYVNQAKGIIIGNLPMYAVDNPALISRALLTRSKDVRETPEIPDLDKEILKSERDEIATLLMQCYFGLEDRGFIFPGEMASEGTQGKIYDPETQEYNEVAMLGTLEYWDLLSDPVKYFIQSETQPGNLDSELAVDDAYFVFEKWCRDQGIPTPAKQTFTNEFSLTYNKKYRGTRQNRKYMFIGCELISTVVQDKLNTGVDGRKTQYSGALWNSFRRVQLSSYFNNYLDNFKKNISNIEKKAEVKHGYPGSGNTDKSRFLETERRVQPLETSSATSGSDLSSGADVLTTQTGNDEHSDSEKYGSDYFKILENFEYSFTKDDKEIKVFCKAGSIRKLPFNVAIHQRQLGRVEKACPDGQVWDAIEKVCISTRGVQ